MKTLNIRSLVVAILTVMATHVGAQTWNFSSVGTADQTNLNADTQNWIYESTNNRWKQQVIYNNVALTANGNELEFTKGLLFTTTAADQIRVDAKKQCLTLNNKSVIVTIPSLKAGSQITIVSKSSSSSAARGITATNVTVTSGFDTSLSQVTSVGTVTADGDVQLQSTGGLYVFSIVVGTTGGGDTGGTTVTPTATAGTLNLTRSQLQLTATDGSLNYYNQDELASVNVDKSAGTLTVTPVTGTATVYTKSIANLSFSTAAEASAGATITNHGVEITEANGWLESAYVKFSLLSGATSYHIYIKGGQYADYTRIDQPLVRDYGTYGRADAVGLKAGTYEMKVVPVINGAEDETQASVASALTVRNYQREGFAFLNRTEGIGAYNLDGTLKTNAKVLYVTAATAKTISTDVITGSKSTVCTGLQTIINAYQKGYDTTPITFRIIGKVSHNDLDTISSSSEGLQVKGRNAYSTLNITMEGIGDDATISGFGVLVRNANSVEFRNFAIMLCMDDCLSLDTENSNVWVHNMDFFYGSTGTDADQVKGDGTVDVKGDSRYITISANHFFDSGKSSLCGMTSETGPNYISYDHNWFDHSDSRHPRIRTMSVHIWNNYYDGCAKYGVGVTSGASAFVEGNFFRDTKDPMMSSQQGTDGEGAGTFSGENGGIIKSYANVYAEKGTTSNYTVITQQASASDFDCYQASTRDEQVPATYTAKVGGSKYDNFDTTASLMYSYTPLQATAVPSHVTGFYGAGRVNHGDFKWDFSGKDSDSSVDTALKTALQNYQSAYQGGFE
jgi:pectate lyase/lipopolysaccharide export system protein LptA